MSKQTAMHLNFANFNDPLPSEKRIDINYPNSPGEGIIIEGDDTDLICSSVLSNSSNAISTDGSPIPDDTTNSNKIQCADNTSNQVTCHDASGSLVHCCPNCSFDEKNVPNLCGPMIYYDETTGETAGWYCPTEDSLYNCDPKGTCMPKGSDHSLQDCTTHCKKKYWCDNKTLNSTNCYDDPNASGKNLCKDNPNYEKFLPDASPGIDYGTGEGQVNPCDLTKQFVSIGDVKTPACAMINGWDCANTANNLGTQSGCAQAENHTKGCRRIDSSLFTTKIKNELAKELGGNTKQFATRSGDLGTDIKYHGEDTVNVPIGVKITGYSGIQPCSPNAGNFSAGIYDNFCGESQANFCEGEGKNLHNSANDMYYKDVPNIKIGADPSLYQGLKFELGSKNQNACDGWNNVDVNGNGPYISPASEGEVVIVPTPGGAGNDGSISCSDYCAGHTDNNYPICVDGYLALDSSLYEGGNLDNEYYQRPYWYDTTLRSNLDVGCDGSNVPMAPGRKQIRSDVNYGFYKQICRCSNKQTN